RFVHRGQRKDDFRQTQKNAIREKDWRSLRAPGRQRSWTDSLRCSPAFVYLRQERRKGSGSENTVIPDDQRFIGPEELFLLRFRPADVDGFSRERRRPAVSWQLDQFAQLHSQPAFTDASLKNQHAMTQKKILLVVFQYLCFASFGQRQHSFI